MSNAMETTEVAKLRARIEEPEKELSSREEFKSTSAEHVERRKVADKRPADAMLSLVKRGALAYFESYRITTDVLESLVDKSLHIPRPTEEGITGNAESPKKRKDLPSGLLDAYVDFIEIPTKVVNMFHEVYKRGVEWA